MQRYFSRRNYESDKAMFDDMMKYIRELEEKVKQLESENEGLKGRIEGMSQIIKTLE